jgi:CheY-like chemotaxis protein
MAVHQALRHVAATEGMASRGEFALQVRRLADTESALQRLTAEGAQRIDSAEQSLRRMQDVHRATPDASSSPQAAHARTGVSGRIGDPGLKIASFSSRPIPSPLDPVADALMPVRHWAESLPRELAPQLQAARALRELASQMRPLLLLVDDDEFQLKVLQNLLGGDDYELMTASSGATAIASLRRRRPDMMLVDIGLPDIDGLELVRFIKGIPAFAPIAVIMITGRSDKESVVASIKTGAAGYVVKPLSREVLLRKVADCLALPSRGPVSDSAGDIHQDAPS